MPYRWVTRRSGERERAAHADAERCDARLETLQVATLEDSDQRLLASRLELVNLYFLFL